MEVLGRLDGGSAAERSLGPLVEQYRGWIETRRREVEGGSLPGARRETAQQLLDYATAAADRMASGVARLGEDADLLDAFRVANRAVARALRQRLGDQIGPDGPRWRPFQLAFLLLNLPGLSDPKDGHRETVDLLFFPTGGGKTEAYLGLAAVAMVLRRLRHPGDDGLAGAGVSVLMRYTLRLLTLDQLARAAGLRSGDGAGRGRRAVRLVAVRDRALGGERGHAEHPRPEGRRPPRLGTGEGDGVQEEPRPQPVADPPGELSLVRTRVRARVVRPPTQRRAAERAAHRLCQLGMRLQRRPSPAGHRGGRAALPAAARVSHRGLRQVRLAAVGGAVGAPCSAGRTAPTRTASTAPPNRGRGSG